VQTVVKLYKHFKIIFEQNWKEKFIFILFLINVENREKQLKNTQNKFNKIIINKE